MTNSGRKLDRLTIRGFKSIELLEDLELGSLNILIGANGAGKSNFVEFFRLLGEMVQQRLQAYVKQNGPADGYFFNGVRHTKKIEAHFKFGKNGYKFTLEPTAEGGIIIGTEGCEFYGDIVKNHSPYMASGNSESVLKDHRSNSEPATYVWNSVSNWRVYHFHDTSMTAGMRRDGGVEQSDRLAPNGENELDDYPWCGHAVLMGNQELNGHKADDVLLLFDRSKRSARRKYRDFVVDGTKNGRRDELVGCGLRRSLGVSGASDYEAFDERILGSGGFVESLSGDGVQRNLRRQDVSCRDNTKHGRGIWGQGGIIAPKEPDAKSCRSQGGDMLLGCEGERRQRC